MRVAEPDAETVAALRRLVEQIAATDPAYIAESKPTGAAIHFRRKPSLEAAAHAALERGMRDVEGFHIHRAKMAFELRPDGVSKAAAVAALMGEVPFTGRRAIYFGDDATDEPAFEWANGNGGVSIKVGEGDTAARCRLAAPCDVHAALRALAGTDGAGA